MTATNQAIITEAYQKIGIVAVGKAPSSAQSSTGITVLNDNILTQQRDGWRLGWYPQTITNLSSNAPLRDEDIADVKLCLAAWLAVHWGVEITPPTGPDDVITLGGQIVAAFRRLNKRSLRYVEADLGELSRPQGGPWGGPNWL